jgi:hypothetical protein
MKKDNNKDVSEFPHPTPFLYTQRKIVFPFVSQTHVEMKHVACKININFAFCVTLKKYICQKGKLFYILLVRIPYELFGKDQKHVITAYNFMIIW